MLDLGKTHLEERFYGSGGMNERPGKPKVPAATGGIPRGSASEPVTTSNPGNTLSLHLWPPPS